MEVEGSKTKEHVDMNGRAAAGEARGPPVRSPEGHTQPLTNGEVPRPGSLDLTELTMVCAALAATIRSNVTRQILLKLPTFDGELTEWLLFKAAVEQSEPYFNSVENSFRLRACLRGEAKDVTYSAFIGAGRTAEANRHAATEEAREPTEPPEGHTQPLANEEVPRPDGLDLKELTEACAAIATTIRSNATRDILLKLPIFNGSSKEWLRFITAYEESAPYFTEVENRFRLRACLRGSAKSTAYCLFLGTSTAAEAIDELRQRFGRPDVLIEVELDKLLAQPTEENLRDICNFARQVSSFVAMIKALNQTEYLYSALTQRDILAKLPDQICFRYFQFIKDNTSDEPILVKIDNFLRQTEDRISILLGPETGGENRRNERAGRPGGRTSATSEGESSHGDQPEDSENENEIDYKHTSPYIIAAAEMDKLCALPEIADRKREICDFELKVAISIIRIKALHVKEYLYSNPEVVRAVVNKLPFSKRLYYCDYVARKAEEGDEMARLSKLNLVSLGEFLLNMMHAAQCYREEPEEDRQEPKPRHQWRRRRGRYPTSRGRAYHTQH